MPTLRPPSSPDGQSTANDPIRSGYGAAKGLEFTRSALFPILTGPEPEGEAFAENDQRRKELLEKIATSQPDEQNISGAWNVLTEGEIHELRHRTLEVYHSMESYREARERMSRLLARLFPEDKDALEQLTDTFASMYFHVHQYHAAPHMLTMTADSLELGEKLLATGKISQQDLLEIFAAGLGHDLKNRRHPATPDKKGADEAGTEHITLRAFHAIEQGTHRLAARFVKEKLDNSARARICALQLRTVFADRLVDADLFRKRIAAATKAQERIDAGQPEKNDLMIVGSIQYLLRDPERLAKEGVTGYTLPGNELDFAIKHATSFAGNCLCNGDIINSLTRDFPRLGILNAAEDARKDVASNGKQCIGKTWDQYRDGFEAFLRGEFHFLSFLDKGARFRKYVEGGKDDLGTTFTEQASRAGTLLIGPENVFAETYATLTAREDTAGCIRNIKASDDNRIMNALHACAILLAKDQGQPDIGGYKLTELKNVLTAKLRDSKAVTAALGLTTETQNLLPTPDIVDEYLNEDILKNCGDQTIAGMTSETFNRIFLKETEKKIHAEAPSIDITQIEKLPVDKLEQFLAEAGATEEHLREKRARAAREFEMAGEVLDDFKKLIKRVSAELARRKMQEDIRTLVQATMEGKVVTEKAHLTFYPVKDNARPLDIYFPRTGLKVSYAIPAVSATSSALTEASLFDGACPEFSPNLQTAVVSTKNVGVTLEEWPNQKFELRFIDIHCHKGEGDELLPCLSFPEQTLVPTSMCQEPPDSSALTTYKLAVKNSQVESIKFPSSLVTIGAQERDTRTIIVELSGGPTFTFVVDAADCEKPDWMKNWIDGTAVIDDGRDITNPDFQWINREEYSFSGSVICDPMSCGFLPRISRDCLTEVQLPPATEPDSSSDPDHAWPATPQT